jgi:hypothetical protein
MLENYKNLKSINIKNKPPKTFFPYPNERDYERGFITRYFTQMRGTPGSPIFEINRDTFSQYSNTNYYLGVELNWKIKGDLEDKWTEKGEYIPSVHSVNILAIREAEKILPELNLYLVNTKQFHKLV